MAHQPRHDGSSEGAIGTAAPGKGSGDGEGSTVSRAQGEARTNAAVSIAVDRWERVIRDRGQVYVKEGGQSNFTSEVVADLEKRRVSTGGGCVHVSSERLKPLV